MKLLIHLIAESEVGQHVQEIACLERKEHRLEDAGLTLLKAKKLLGAIQQENGRARCSGSVRTCPQQSLCRRYNAPQVPGAAQKAFVAGHLVANDPVRSGA
jgi:hypothetical protein